MPRRKKMKLDVSKFPFPLKIQGQVVTPDEITPELVFTQFRIIQIELYISLALTGAGRRLPPTLNVQEASRLMAECIVESTPNQVIVIETPRATYAPKESLYWAFPKVAWMELATETTVPLNQTSYRAKKNHIDSLIKESHKARQETADPNAAIQCDRLSVYKVIMEPVWSPEMLQGIENFKRQFTEELKAKLKIELAKTMEELNKI
jgi:hypothetical protein